MFSLGSADGWIPADVTTSGVYHLFVATDLPQTTARVDAATASWKNVMICIARQRLI